MEEVALLTVEMAKGDIVLLDYETNADVADLSKPLSHASLIAQLVPGSCRMRVSLVQPPCEEQPRNVFHA